MPLPIFILPSGRKFTNFFLLCERLLPGNGEIQLNLQYQKPFMTSSIKKQILTGRNGIAPSIINRFLRGEVNILIKNGRY